MSIPLQYVCAPFSPGQQIYPRTHDRGGCEGTLGKAYGDRLEDRGTRGVDEEYESGREGRICLCEY